MLFLEDHYDAEDFFHMLLLIKDPLTDYVLFLEEDHYVAEDFLHMFLLYEILLQVTCCS